MAKTKVHIIHHTHWDMEWYFTKHDSAALFNLSLRHLLTNLEKSKGESFLFDGQKAPFEDYWQHPSFKTRILKLVKAERLKIGPWYSQPDMRQTTAEGLLRNYHYGSKHGVINLDHYDYIYNPDSFGFAENIPLIYIALNKRNVVLWRGVNRRAIKNAPVFKWQAANRKAVVVYNMVSGYFVGRYLANDENFEAIYQNNIQPAIKNLTMNGKYNVAALPSGGDQQPYNSDLKAAIIKLNQKNDGCQYVLSTWNQFFQELKPQVKNIPVYRGPLTYAFGGRLHKTIGAHRPDIKRLVFTGELRASKILEPLYMLSEFGRDYYPQVQFDQMWKDIILSQSHDAYASCNSDEVNHQILNRLLQAKNIYEANKDLLLTIMTQNEPNRTLTIFNPTNFQGQNEFVAHIATKTKSFSLVAMNKQLVPFIMLEQDKHPGGKNVIYTANGEVETVKPDYYVAKVKFVVSVATFSITKLQVVPPVPKQIEYQSSYKHSLVNKKIKLALGQKAYFVNLLFSYDGGDSYDLDQDPELKVFDLEDAMFIKQQQVEKNGIRNTMYKFKIKLPNSIATWKAHQRRQNLKITIQVTDGEQWTLQFKFSNVPQNLLTQVAFEKVTTSKSHLVTSYGGWIRRANSLKTANIDEQELREKLSNFDLSHGVISTEKLDFTSVEAREYEITKSGDLRFNLFRTPDVLGRHNLRSRPGRASGLPDRKVLIPDSTRIINNLDFNFSVTKKRPPDWRHMEALLISDLTRHSQNLYRYQSRTETWTLPRIQINPGFNKRINIDPRLNLMAWFKSAQHEIIRINNPLQKTLFAKIQFNNQEQTIEIGPYEIKQWKLPI